MMFAFFRCFFRAIQHIVYFLGLILAFGTAWAKMPGAVDPDGWQTIVAQIQAHQHQMVVSQDGWQASNPGQHWQTRFDAHGFVVTPQQANWTWGLRLHSYGIAGAEQTPSQPPAIHVEGNRVEYAWDNTLTEWLVNDARGLEHGFTLRQRPAGTDGEVHFTLHTRGNLLPRTHDNGLGADFINADGSTVLHYTGLKVFDAHGRDVPARITADGVALRLAVDDRGAVYPLTIDPVAQQHGYLKASNTDVNDNFGWTVAISGDTLVVGAPSEASNATGVDGNGADNSASESGAAYVFVRSSGVWSQQAYIKAANTEMSDKFGWAVTISGDTLVVGAPFEASNATGVNGNGADNSASGSGAAYVFVRSGSTWSQQAYLKASNTGANDNFGATLSISGDTVVVGANAEDSNATGVNGNGADDSANESGAAYVFVRTGSAWSQQAYLKASNTQIDDHFGSVSISNDTLVVGAYGEDSNATGINGNQANNAASEAGALYVFTRTGSVWSQQAYLKASNTGANDRLGELVALSGDTVVAGAGGEKSNATGVNGNQANNTADYAGAAYVFTRSGSTWSQQAYLKASNTNAYDYFGGAVAVSGNLIVVGANDEESNATGINGNQADNSATTAGAAYVFTRSGSTWTQQAYLKASNTGAGDAFGWTVAADGETVVVGAYHEDSDATGVNGADNDAASDAGAAYVFTLQPDSNVQGNAVDIADGDNTPDSADDTNFGNVEAGFPLSKTYTIQNTSGDATLRLTSSAPNYVTLSGAGCAEFSVTAQPASADVLPLGNTVFTVQYAPINVGIDTCVVNIANNDSDENPYDFTINGVGTDITPPETHLTATPADPSTNSAASFSFTGTDHVGVTSFMCNLDSGGFVACSNPQSYAGLALGAHTFQVKAIDAAGNVDASPASHTWTIIPAPPPSAPSAPSQMQATAAGIANMSVIWLDNATTENGFRLYRDGLQIKEFPSAPVGSTVSFTDSGLTCATTYTYEVLAYNGAGDSARTSATGKTVPCPPVVPPPTPPTPTPADPGTLSLTMVQYNSQITHLPIATAIVVDEFGNLGTGNNNEAILVLRRIIQPSMRVGDAVGIDLQVSGMVDGNDYHLSPHHVDWATGDDSDKNVILTLVNDTLVESTETLTVTLANASSGAAIGVNQVTFHINSEEVAPPVNNGSSSTGTSSGSFNGSTDVIPNDAPIQHVGFAHASAQMLSAQPPSDVAQFTPAQLAAIPATSFSGLRAPQLQALTPQAMATLSAGQLAAIPALTLAALTPEQLIAILPSTLTQLHAEQLRQIPPATIAVLSVAQFVALPPQASVGWTADMLTLLPETVIAAFQPAQVAALNSVEVQDMQSQALSRLLVYFNSSVIRPAMVRRLLPLGWQVDANGALTLPPGFAVSTRAVRPNLPANIAFNSQSILMNSSLGLGGKGGDSFNKQGQRLLELENLSQFIMNQDEQGVLHVTGTNHVAGIEFCFIPDMATVVAVNTHDTPVGLHIADTGFYTLTLPSGLRFQVTPTSKDWRALATLTGNTPIRVGKRGDVLLDFSTAVNATRRARASTRAVGMFDPYVEPAPEGLCVAPAPNAPPVCDFANAPEHQHPGLYAGEKNQQQRSRTRELARVVYPDGTSQTIRPTLLQPDTFTQIGNQIPGVSQVEFLVDGTFLAIFQGKPYRVLPSFRIMEEAANNDASVPAQVNARIDIPGDGTLLYTILLEETQTTPPRRSALQFNPEVEALPEDLCVAQADGSVNCAFSVGR